MVGDVMGERGVSRGKFFLYNGVRNRGCSHRVLKKLYRFSLSHFYQSNIGTRNNNSIDSTDFFPLINFNQKFSFCKDDTAYILNSEYHCASLEVDKCNLLWPDTSWLDPHLSPGEKGRGVDVRERRIASAALARVQVLAVVGNLNSAKGVSSVPEAQL